MRALALFLLFSSAAHPALSEIFQIQGTTLIYDTEGDDDTEIDNDHPELLLEMLRAHDDIETLQLNSGGGKIWPAHEMADTIIDFELNTHVHGKCESACVRIFLAGATRTMSRGSKLGFHQFYWGPEDAEDYYDTNKVASDWSSPFDFVSWVYTDTQQEVYEHLSYMIRRNVDADFAVRSIAIQGHDMWRPYRKELLAAGVLTE